jgi:hypothetical protein
LAWEDMTEKYCGVLEKILKMIIKEEYRELAMIKRCVGKIIFEFLFRWQFLNVH